MDFITERLKLKDIFPDKAGTIATTLGVPVDDVEFIRKGLTADDVRFDEGEQAVITTITTGAVDRDMEIVDPSGAVLDDYLKNPVVMFGHDYHQLPIGKNLWVKQDGNKLIAKTQYANTPFAQEVYNYRKGGFPLAQSIGFIPMKWEDLGDESDERKTTGARRKYTAWKLLEYSDVPVPSNPEAIAIAVAKGLVPGDKSIVEKPGWDETDEYIRHRVREPGQFRDDTFRTVTVKRDKPRVMSIMGKLKSNEGKDDDPMTVQNVMFPKADDWTMESAKSWMSEHSDLAKSVSMSDILADEGLIHGAMKRSDGTDVETGDVVIIRDGKVYYEAPETERREFLSICEETILKLEDDPILTLAESPPVEKEFDVTPIADIISAKVGEFTKARQSIIRDTIETGFARLYGKA